METAVATAFLGKIAPKLFAFLKEKHAQRRSLERDIQYIRKEFRMITAAIQDHDRRRRHLRHSNGGSDDDVQTVWIQLVRDLAYSIEDCVDRFTHRAKLPPATSSWLRQTVHGVRTATTRSKFAAAVRELRKISEEASKLRSCYYVSSGGGEYNTYFLDSETPTHTIAADLVGMDEPRDEVLELIRETQGQAKQLKVISIVGFGGLGKTILAREVYEHERCGRQYEPRAWVHAGERGAGDVLEEILDELGMPVDAATNCGNVIKLSTRIRDFLGSKRFFIVIDDMRKEFWNIIKNAFPALNGMSSRVIVTTAVHSIANACSAHGHVYMMRTLNVENSRRLFFKEASLVDPPPDAELGSEALKKGDGLPLALVTIAQFLQSRGNPTRVEWAKVGNNLGELLETNDTLARMNKVLVHSYSSLHDHVLKACLLYMGIFPGGRPVRTEGLIRRWLAEGFVEDCGAANDRFRELVDRSIVLPAALNSNNNTEVKTCQTHGMMLEFVLRKSVRESFVTLLHGQDRPPGDDKIRWLSLNHYSGNPSNDLSHVRSLTVFGKTHKSVLEFSRYELLRVLDLEECDDHLDDKHLLEICYLLLLRYLSLRGNSTIEVLPKEISKLKYLETLDLRRTNITVLPIQVLKMASLIHLFGAFKLQDVGRKLMSKLQAFLSEKSKLETLSGFVTDESRQGFAQLMGHMEHLTKVKIRWESTVDDNSNHNHLSRAIQGFIERGTNMNDTRSLSLGSTSSTEWPQDLLNFSLENSCYLHSLKLHANNICSLPLFVTMLSGLTELCFSSPNSHLSGDILVSVSRVSCLHYLKLTASQMGSLEIENGVLDSLRGLCIVAESMAGLEIKQGALPRLESLRLLCKDLNGRVLCGIKMEWLGRLKEVALHDGVSEGTKQDWREAAKKHPKRPKVLFMQTAHVVDRMQMGSGDENSESYVAPTPMAEDTVQEEVNYEGSVVRKRPAGVIARLIHGSKLCECEYEKQRKQEREEAAGMHPKRPKVSFVDTVVVEEVEVMMQMEQSAAAAAPIAVGDDELRPGEG
ncbi:hypothetical protein BRADI_4g12893v3, partial [Brachypodium distachyon]